MKKDMDTKNSSILNLTKRLNKAIDYLKFEYRLKTIGEISEKIGFGRTNLSAALNGSERYLTDSLLNKFTNAFPVLNKDWLLTGKGEMLKSEVSLFNENEEKTKEPTGYYYPSVSASAGLSTQTLNDELERIPVYLPNFGKDIDFINVYGDSMYPKFNAGEIIGIKLTEFQYLNYGYPYVVIMKNGDAFIKYVRKGKDDEHIILESENKFYEPREFHIELIQAFYSIRGVIKKEMM
ncbi:S24 family peptidase [Ornithobacterium rhinotracheale]